jgi:hypothetical protein
MKYDEKMLDEMIKMFGKDRIPNPKQYPKQFKYLTLVYENCTKERKVPDQQVQKKQ